MIVEDDEFPQNVESAILNGFKRADALFLGSCVRGPRVVDASGSCACVLLMVEEILYFANLGDSRALMSMNEGRVVKAMTMDHKPNVPSERHRILEAHGGIYK